MTAAVMHRPSGSHTRSRSTDASMGSTLGMTRSHASGSISALAAASTSTASTSSTMAYAYHPPDDRRTLEHAPYKARRLTKRSSSEDGKVTPAVLALQKSRSPVMKAAKPSRPTSDDDADYSSSGKGRSTDFGDTTVDEDAVTDHDVIETDTFVWGKDVRGRRMVNQYVRIEEVGRGVHGKVWLCEETNPETGDAVGYCAMKEVYREDKRNRKLRRLNNNESEARLEMDDKVRQEIAIMKCCNHPHVVRLKEVINDPASRKIFMVLEYMAGGQIAWRGAHSEPLMTVDESRRTFRDVVLGLQYLHFQGIIHRDIKPANLLWDKTDPVSRIVKISDFGVSHISEVVSPSVGGDDMDALRRKTAGSPAFFAPELCYSHETPAQTPTYLSAHSNGHDPTLDNTAYFPSSRSPSPRPDSSRRASSQRTLTAISLPLSSAARSAAASRTRPPVNKAIDIWALGVTLYCLLFGTTPFLASNEYELFEIIPTTRILLPECMGADRLPLYPGGGRNPAEAAEGRETIELLGRLLEKDPTKRITLDEVKVHPWVLRNLEDPEGWIRGTDPRASAADGQISVTTEEVARATVSRMTDERVVKPKGGKTAVLVRATQALGLKSWSKRIARNSASRTPATVFTPNSITPSSVLTPQRTRSDSGSKPVGESHLKGLLERFRGGVKTPRGGMSRRPSHSTNSAGSLRDDPASVVSTPNTTPVSPSVPTSSLPTSTHPSPAATNGRRMPPPDNTAASRDWSHFRSKRETSSSNAFDLDDDFEDEPVPSDEDDEDEDESDFEEEGQGPQAFADALNGWAIETDRATAQLIYNSRRRSSAMAYDDVDELADAEDVGDEEEGAGGAASADEQEVEIKSPRDRLHHPPSPWTGGPR